jgi:long-chain acyl-CoA synthetase
MLQENFTKFVKDSIISNWDRIAFTNYESDSLTYGQVAYFIHHFHRLFEKCGIKKGDKIALIGRNSANWAVAYMASITYGAVVVPILPNFMPNDVHHIVNHSDSVVFFANQSNWEQLEISQMYKLNIAISLDDFNLLYSKKEANCNQIHNFREHNQDQIKPSEFNFSIVPNQELFAISYTSGTTGFSKGVMLTHNNITANMVYSRTNMPLVPGDKILSFLPLAHAYGCAIEFLYPFTLGCHITFLGKMPTPQILIKAFKEIKPRLILSVPLIIEKIYKKQIKPIISQPKVRLMMLIPFMETQILKKVNKKLAVSFGDNFHEIVIGGAALNEEVQVFLKKAKFPFTIGYGMTECGPLISYASWKINKTNSAGRCVDTMIMKIDSPDPENIVGEILVKGENVFSGYYKNKTVTSETIDADGWLHTGDLGTMDSEGFLFIKGRSKSMILGSSGQNIYPEEIESRINNWPYVMESLVVERKENLVALIYPDMEVIDKGKIGESKLMEIFENQRKQLNKELPVYMQVAKVQIFPNEFEKTPKKSIKRFLYS